MNKSDNKKPPSKGTVSKSTASKSAASKIPSSGKSGDRKSSGSADDDTGTVIEAVVGASPDNASDKEKTTSGPGKAGGQREPEAKSGRSGKRESLGWVLSALLVLALVLSLAASGLGIYLVRESRILSGALDRLDAATASGIEERSRILDRLSAVARELDQLRSGIADGFAEDPELAERVEALAAGLAAVEQQLASVKTGTDEDTTATGSVVSPDSGADDQSVSLDSLTRAVNDGTGYEALLDALISRYPALSELAPWSASPPPSRPMLWHELDALIDAMTDAPTDTLIDDGGRYSPDEEEPAADEFGWWSWLLAPLRGIVTITPTQEPPTDDAQTNETQTSETGTGARQRLIESRARYDLATAASAAASLGAHDLRLAEWSNAAMSRIKLDETLTRLLATIKAP